MADMNYQVRKNGRIYAQTDSPECQYKSETEATLQEAGFDIYENGKRKKRIKTARRRK